MGVDDVGGPRSGQQGTHLVGVFGCERHDLAAAQEPSQLGLAG
jgi:hypothetical protein